jgi:hypothetical protein
MRRVDKTKKASRTELMKSSLPDASRVFEEFSKDLDKVSVKSVKQNLHRLIESRESVDSLDKISNLKN